MNAAAIMDPHPTILRPTDMISTAARFIMEKRYRSLPVVDEHGCYLGMFGVNCLLKQVLPKAALMEKGLTNLSFIHDSLADLHERFNELEDKPVSMCTNKEVETIAPDTPLIETLMLLYTQRASIPVVEPGSCKLLGMISYWDVGKRILAS
ncbi:MAG: CBS domain-containing protein [Sedimenticola sp.]